MITVCENCFQPIYANEGVNYYHHQGPRGSHEGSTYCATFVPTLPASAVATYGIEVWETEDPTLIVMGTHDPARALIAANRMYRDIVGPLDVPEGLAEALKNADKWWINQEHPEYDSEHWPDGVTSMVERDGDTPALRVSW